GTFTSGTIIGFDFAFPDLHGSGGTVGVVNTTNPPANSAGTSGFGTRATWRIGSGLGLTNPAGDCLWNIEFWQFPAHSEGVNSMNPITNMYRFLWTPSSFAPRVTHFDLVPSVFGGAYCFAVYVGFDPDSGQGIYIPNASADLGSVT